MLKAIHASEDIMAAREKAIRMIEKLRGFRLIKAAELTEAGVEETLSYYASPEEHWWRVTRKRGTCLTATDAKLGEDACHSARQHSRPSRRLAKRKLLIGRLRRAQTFSRMPGFLRLPLLVEGDDQDERGLEWVGQFGTASTPRCPHRVHTMPLPTDWTGMPSGRWPTFIIVL
jgi:hypothetical protein